MDITMQQMFNSLDLEPGDNLGNYQIIFEIDRGGMGAVYKAIESKSKRIVAIKVMYGHQNQIAKKRFLREAQITAKLQHPNIVRVLNAGEMQGHLYLVMEFIEGFTLKEIIKQNRDYLEDLKIIIKVAQGLQYAHRQKIIHRDIKPANIMIQKDGIVKIMDFGLAKNIHTRDHHFTKTGDIIGTPHYMAPEQLSGNARNIDHQADIYALGAIIYEVVSKQKMLLGDTTLQIFSNIQEQKYIPLSKHISSINKNLEIIWKKSVAKKKQRYKNMSFLRKDLEFFIRGQKIATKSFTLWSIKYVATFVAFLSLLFVAIYRFSEKQVDVAPRKNIYFEGRLFFESGQYHKALKNFNNSKKYSRRSMLSFYRGACMYHISSKKNNSLGFNKAIVNLELAQKYHPYKVEIIEYIAKSYLALKDYSNAKCYYLKCIEMQPKISLYYTELAKIYLKEKKYNNSAKNLTKAIALDPGNIEACELLFEISSNAPHLQKDNWQLLEYIFFTVRKMERPILFQKKFESIKRKTYYDYLDAREKQSAKKSNNYYIHIAAATYAENSFFYIEELKTGIHFFKQTLQNKNENLYIRFLAAKSLVALCEFEFLANNLNKFDATGYIFAVIVLRQSKIPIENVLINKYLKRIKKYTQEEQSFIQIFVAEMFYAHKEKNIGKKKLLKKWMFSSNPLLELVAACSYFSNFKDKKKAFSVVRKYILSKNQNYRIYAHFYLWDQINIKKMPESYFELFILGLKDKNKYVNMICLFSLRQCFSSNQFTFKKLMASPDFHNGLSFLQKFSSLLYNLSQKEDAELSLRSSCLWAFSLPPYGEFLEFIKNKKKYSSLKRCLAYRYYGITKLFLKDKIDWSALTSKNEDVIFKANLLFVFCQYLMMPINLISDKITDPLLRASILNAMAHSRGFVRRNNRYASFLLFKKYKDTTFSPLRQAAYRMMTSVSLLKTSINLCRELLDSSDTTAKIGASTGLFIKTKHNLFSYSEIIKHTLEYIMTPYHSFELEKFDDLITKRYQANKKQSTLRALNMIIELNGQNSECFYARGLFYVGKKKLDLAISDLEKAILLFPDFRYKVTLAEVFLEIKEKQKSEKIVSNIDRLVQKPILRKRIANIYFQLEKYEKSRFLYKRLFLSYPHSKKYILGIISSYCKENDTKNAILYVGWGRDIFKEFPKKIFNQKDFAEKNFEIIKNHPIIKKLPVANIK